MDGFFGIEIARRALETSQYGMNVTAHNVANANTPGYTRQRAVLEATESFPAPYWNRPLVQGQLGTGVRVKVIERVRDSYFDGQIRKENQALGGWQVKENALKQLETIFNEPSEAGLQNAMGEFWNAWQQLSRNPESISIRSSVLEMGRMLVNSFNQLSDKLSRLQENLNDQVAAKVNEINSIAEKIASINHDVLRIRVYGTEPNDLLDQRDQLIDQLSKIVDVKITELDSGVMLVYINGRQLVSEQSANQLQAVANPLNNGFYDVKWALDGESLVMYDGELKALVDSRDVIVPKYRGNLDLLASTLIAEVNNLHSRGYGLDGTTGWNFFTGTSAKDIALSSDVDDPKHIAAASSWPPGGAPGDNTNALAIGALKNAAVSVGGSLTTMDDYYRSIVANLGIDSQEASRMVENGKLYYDLIENHRQSVSGVSLDEEATNMIKFQRAYQAAARLISVFDEMLDVLINEMVR
ncbi:MAG: flagellar hook-associated protein FlgK [Actinomycetota bacterium]|nr:flagellar hook-associated protein FlgK [Actinomycetota bacterium]